MAITSMGIGSGLDIQSLVTQLVAAERAPAENRLNKQEFRLSTELSALGSLKGALSSFHASLSGLRSLYSFNQRTASSSDDALFTATASTDAMPASYDVEVTALAQAHKLASGPVADAQAAYGTGTLTFQFGDPALPAQSVTIDATNDSLEGIRDAVNDADIGVRASIINGDAGYQLVFVSEKTGVDNSLKVTVTDDDLGHTDATGLSALTYDPGVTENMTQMTAAQDANVLIDGISVTRSTNTVSDAIEGVTLQLESAAVGTVETLTIKSDTAKANTAVKGFVDGYNALVNAMNSLSSYDAESGQAGVLLGDATLRGIRSQIATVLGSAIEGLSGGYRSLADLGIATQNNGTLSLDSSKLSDALSNDFDAVGRLFADAGQTSDPLVNYLGSTDDSTIGDYAINVTQLATKGLFSGTAITNKVIDGTNDTFTLKVDGVQSGTITLAQADYTGSEAALAAELQSKINGDSAISGAGVSVTVTYNAGTDSFQIESDSYGSASTVEITAANASLGFAAAAGTAGLDVAGTIGGIAATGSGQELTGTGTAEGIKVEIVGGATGARGNVIFSRGAAAKLDDLIGGFLDSSASLSSRTTSLTDRLRDLDDDRAKLQARIDAIELRYTKQFSALDALVGSMQSTSQYLAQQLAALPGMAAKSSSK